MKTVKTFSFFSLPQQISAELLVLLSPNSPDVLCPSQLILQSERKELPQQNPSPQSPLCNRRAFFSAVCKMTHVFFTQSPTKGQSTRLLLPRRHPGGDRSVAPPPRSQVLETFYPPNIISKLLLCRSPLRWTFPVSVSAHIQTGEVLLMTILSHNSKKKKKNHPP